MLQQEKKSVSSRSLAYLSLATCSNLMFLVLNFLCTGGAGAAPSRGSIMEFGKDSTSEIGSLWEETKQGPRVTAMATVGREPCPQRGALPPV